MTEQEMEILQGTISAVVFQNYENGYAVLRLAVGGGQSVTVVGTIPLPAVGEQLMVTGRWSNHSSYGKQFEAEVWERMIPQSSTEILAYLSSRIIKGIGPKTAARIVEHFGEETLLVMEREPQRLAEIPGISREKAIGIGEEFRLQIGMRQLMEFFAVHHLPAELAVRTYKIYGDSTLDLLYDDPYLLMDEGLEAPFGAVDRFAIELGVAGDDPRRVEAGLLFELSYNLSAGHSFLPEEKLAAATAQLLSVDLETVRAGIARAKEAERIVPDTLAGIQVDYLPQLHEAECCCAQRLLEFAANSFPERKDMDSLLRQVSAESGFHYSGQQEQAIRAGDLHSLCAAAGNALEHCSGAVETPAIRQLLDAHGAIASQMTGSGAAVFGLFDGEEQAAQAAAELRQHYRQVYLCRPDRGGARVVHGRPLVHKKQKTAE